MDPIHARYAELLDAGFPGGQVCLTWCRNSDLEEVARRFGAVPETGLWATPDELEDLEYEHGEELVELTTMGEWTIAMEPSGFQGVRSAVLEPLSVGGCAFGVFWNEELDNEVAYAVDGQIVTSFDLTDIGQRSGSDPAALDELLQQVGLHDGLPAQARKARILALGEAISGQRLTPRWLRSDQFTILVTDPLPDPLVPAALLNPRAPFLDEPEMARILANPSPAVLLDITKLAVSFAVAAIDLEDSLGEKTLRVLEHGERSPGEREALRSRLARLCAETDRQAERLWARSTSGAGDEAMPLWRRGAALVLLEQALDPSPVDAARSTAERAGNFCTTRTERMRMRVLSNVVARIAYDLRHP
ncbi:DUF6461 domain-containing protein [Streptosporangium lutulentum]|uniref:Uncharacterized protein n=1 Tax=Streptosporangium lutulentum TaxID=1461250 RepID=A0ABT9Q3Q8_9ACTN|nr:DUF6461 domain-containing protein [Streptosporangium lutulentum]MDP9840978.1 hypothetical protein [Streptosporangium lutulentum]